MTRTRSTKHLAWLDLEMTGLEPLRDHILQAALIITDENLTPLEECCFDVWQPEAHLTQMSPFVRDMHEESGLLARVEKSKIDLMRLERELFERIAGWCEYPATLCGNSIGQDKRFLEAHLPGLAGYLHYRVLDVSSLKILAGLWFPETGRYLKPTAGAHDALFDVRQSIAELSHYRAHVFRTIG